MIMDVAISKYEPKRTPWSALDLFMKIDLQKVTISQKMKHELQEFFWYDLCSEYDSVNLYKVLKERKDQYSSDFLNFLEVWYLDERNHTEGFSSLYQLFYGMNREDIWSRLSDRPSDFSELEEFLADEFELCVLFAYDEFASVMTYKKDVFYNEFGAPEFVEWIKRVRADEALHFGNLVKLIRFRHAHRLPETKEVLRKIANLEQQRKSYKGTFLFDHECPHFLLTQDELSDECINTVLRKITNDKTATMKQNVAN